jgi:hypothetical protein
MRWEGYVARIEVMIGLMYTKLQSENFQGTDYLKTIEGLS